jgi:hypothetical protein
MKAQVFYSNQLIVDGKDVDKILPHGDLILDEENPAKELVVKIKNTSNEYLLFFYLKFIFTNSIQIKKISYQKFSRKFRVTLTTESGSYSFSSDEDSYQDNFFVGVFYTENPDYINSLIGTDTFTKKFILIPRSVKPNEELEYNLRVELLDSSNHFFRKPNIDIYYQAFSNTYYRAFSNDYPPVGILISSTNYAPVLSIETVYGQSERAKNYFFSLYPLNGSRLINSSSSFDSYYWKIYDKFLNYIVTTWGNFVGTKFKVNFTYSELLDTYVLDVSTIHEETTIWKYLTDLVYLTLIEISKPLTFNSGFVPNYLRENSEKISSTYVYFLNLLSSNSDVYETIRGDGSFSTSSRALTTREKGDLYALLFSWAKIYVSFLKKLESLGLINIPATSDNPIYLLDLLTSDLEKISIFENNYQNVLTFTFTDNVDLNDLTISVFLMAYAFILSFDGRLLYFYPMWDTFKYAALLFSAVLENISISLATTEIDVNNYSQLTTEQGFSSDTHPYIIRQKLIAYTLLDLTTSFFNHVTCSSDDDLCLATLDKFKEYTSVDDDIVNLFNSYVEIYSCMMEDQGLFFVKNPDICSLTSNIYRNIDVEFFNLWVFLQNINYKIKPTVLQVKIIFGMF